MCGSRPDIAYAVATASQFLSYPKTEHWEAVQHLLKYVASTRDVEITYDGTKEAVPVGYSDADWGGCPSTCKSTTGWLFMLCGGPISWKSQKQRVTALSSCESEFYSLSEAAKEAVWVSYLFDDLQMRLSSPLKIYCDNQGALAVAQNPVLHSQMKHVRFRNSRIREWLQEGTLVVEHLGTKEMIADMLTKAVKTDVHATCLRLAGMRDTRSRGCVTHDA
jgi:hypothetical protein